MSPAERRSLVADLLARDTSDLLEIVRDKGASEAILKAVEEGDLRKAHRLAEEDRRAIDRVLKEKQTIVGAGAEDPEVPTKSGTKRIRSSEASSFVPVRNRFAKARSCSPCHTSAIGVRTR